MPKCTTSVANAGTSFAKTSSHMDRTDPGRGLHRSTGAGVSGTRIHTFATDLMHRWLLYREPLCEAGQALLR